MTLIEFILYSVKAAKFRIWDLLEWGQVYFQAFHYAESVE